MCVDEEGVSASAAVTVPMVGEGNYKMSFFHAQCVNKLSLYMYVPNAVSITKHVRRYTRCRHHQIRIIFIMLFVS